MLKPPAAVRTMMKIAAARVRAVATTMTTIAAVAASRGGIMASEGHSEAAGQEDDERAVCACAAVTRRRPSKRIAFARGLRRERPCGWFGDPRRHAQAARRGWENRR
jgi:hypothetical protein